MIGDTVNSVGPDPEIIGRIRAFDRRRRRLLAQRGACAFVLFLLGAMLVVAAADAALLLEDGWRHALSLAAYALAGAVLWRTGLRHLWRPADDRRLAQWFEQVRPDLREDLLSAVELGSAGAAPRWDSPVFRALLQREVAGRLRTATVEAVLPVRLIRGWRRGAAAAVAGVLLLSALPGLQFPRRLLRALAPVAPIDRVSRVAVRILEPRPPERVVPYGEAIPVVIELSGPPVETAALEVFGGGEGAGGRGPMRPMGAGRFAAELRVGREPLAYRIRAGDALTRRYRIGTAPPPRAVRFTKRYRPPAYSGWPDETAVDESGDLAAIEGTSVEILIETDQPVRSAELRLDLGDERPVIPLRADGPGAWRGSIDLARSGSYRVHLVAAATGFANRFSPSYAVDVRPDAPPTVTIEQPEADRWAAPDERIALAAAAADDVALDRVALEYRVNRDAWTSAEPAPADGAREARVARPWDLLALGLKPGDRVLARFAAVDRKGNRGESTAIRLTIAAAGFERERLRGVDAARRAVESARRLAAAAQEADRRVRETLDAAVRDADPARRRQAAQSAAAAVERARRAAEEARRQIESALAGAPAGRAADDLVLAGREVSRIERQRLESAADALASLAATPDRSDFAAAAGAAGREVARAAGESAALHEAARRLQEAAETEVARTDLARLAEKQARLSAAARSAATDEDREAVARQQRVAAGHAEETAGLLDALAQQGPKNAARAAAALRDGLREAAKAAADEAAVRADPAKIAESTERRIEAARRDVAPIAAAAEAAARQARAELAARAGDAADTVRAARETAERGAPDEGRARAVAADRLRDRAALEERRPAGDAPFVRDLASLADAAEAAPSGDAEAWKALERAAGALDAARAATAAERAARDLAAGERWGARDPASAVQRAGEWQRAEDTMAEAETALRRAGAAAAAGQTAAARAGEAANEIDREMDRRDGARRPDPVAQPADRVAADLAAARAAAQPMLDAARAEIAARAPSLPDRLDALARAAEEERQRTSAGAAAPAELRRSQEELGRRVEQAGDALRRDANAQDLATPEGRERARDGDVAMAMLQRPPPRAEDHLRDAERAETPEERAPALGRASTEQATLRDALAQVAGHYRALASGQPEPTRAALRANEEELNLRATLDERYEPAARLAELAAMTPEAMTEALEGELRDNEAMRRELARMAEQAAASAVGRIAEAADRQALAADRVDAAAAQRAQQEQALARRAAELAGRVREWRENAVPAAAAAAQATPVDPAAPVRQAESAARQAEQALPGAARPDAAPAVQAAAAGLDASAQSMGRMAEEISAAGAENAPASAASQQAAGLARETRALAQALQNLPAPERAAMQQAQAAQAPVGPAAAAAGAELAQAGRHAERLGDAERARAWQEAGARTQATASGEVSAAAGAMSGGEARPAQPAAAAARAAMAARRAEAEQAMASSGAAPAAPADPAAAGMARALDLASAPPDPGAASSAPAPGAALQAAGRAQADAMARERGQMSEGPAHQGSAAELAGGESDRPLPENGARFDPRAWGRLPRDVARDLLDARREDVPAEYRELVEAYFRALATDLQREAP